MRTCERELRHRGADGAAARGRRTSPLKSRCSTIDAGHRWARARRRIIVATRSSGNPPGAADLIGQRGDGNFSRDIGFAGHLPSRSPARSAALSELSSPHAELALTHASAHRYAPCAAGGARQVAAHRSAGRGQSREPKSGARDAGEARVPRRRGGERRMQLSLPGRREAMTSSSWIARCRSWTVMQRPARSAGRDGAAAHSDRRPDGPCA